MSGPKPFHNRAFTQSVTPEFLREVGGAESEDEMVELLERATRLFERSYNAVASVGRQSREWGSWEICVIPAQDADLDSIRRGMQDISHWVREDVGVEA